MDWNAYHFVNETLRDGRPVPPDGETLVHEGPLEMCCTGLYASREAWQALNYATGHTLCRVNCAGEIIEPDDEDKLVCRERTIVARIDASDLLRDFARSCARDVLHLWDAPDVVREYLETGDEALRDAAWAAAWAAARDAARSAAWDAAWAAARAAAWDAARDAAWDAAWAAAWAAARVAARDAQRTRFTEMVNAAFEAA